jgi:hypothetical protein
MKLGEEFNKGRLFFMRKQVKMSVLKRILAVVIAVAVAVSMLTIPDAEVSAVK